MFDGQSQSSLHGCNVHYMSRSLIVAVILLGTTNTV